MRWKSFLLVFFILLLGASATAEAQIAASRRIDWSQAGVSGGIPNRSTICATLNPGATAGQINSAIAACPAGQVVKLNAGTYSLSSGVDFNANNNVTLRGAGPDRTFLVFSGGVSCGGLGADVCFRNGLLNSTDSPGNTANWTAGYSVGTTSITLSSTSNLQVGSLLILDQLNDSSDGGAVFVCDAGGLCATEGPGGTGRSGRVQEQHVRVTAISGNTVTITPGLYMPNWRSSQSPGAWWSSAVPITMSGIEDLSVSHAGSGSVMSGVYFFNAYNCWMKNVKSLNANRNHVWLYQSAHVTVRDSYFYGTQNAASQSYGIETYMNSDALIENNIFQHVTVGMMTGGSTSGTVFAYNYSLDDYYNVASWMQSSSYLHAGGIGFVLFEGNEGIGFTADAIHGTTDFATVFRNVFTGWETGKSQQTVPIHLYTYNRYLNVLGNVLGKSGYHNRYEAATPSGSGGDTAIYTLGWSGNGGTTDSGVPNDPRVKTTLFRWGNYDVVNGAVVWNPAEVPSTVSPFGNPLPGNQTLPTSLYLSGRPSWWGIVPWPAIGPDVTGGQDPTGRAYKLPAHLCYDVTSKTGGILNFNAATCYSSVEDTTPPTVSITAPSSGSTGSGTLTITGAASDNTGVAGVQFKLDGAALGAEATVAPYTVAWDTTGAVNGSHSLSAVARDASGNTATSTAVTVNVNNVQDTTAPSVPSNLVATGVSITQITLTWNASTDNVGVAGYRIFRCQGSGCSATVQVATGTGTSYSDPALTPSTSYTYAVSAFDTASNVSGKSSPASAVTSSLPPPGQGQIASYSFNEGLGNSAADSSLNQNTGSLSGAAWTTAGKFGSGLSFNGTSSFVDAPDMDPLTLQTNATFMAWVSLSSAPVDVASVFNKWSQTTDDEYLFGINPDRTLYFGWQTTAGGAWGTTSYNQVNGTAVIPLGTMTHIAVVRSGASLTFYVNGNLDTSLGNAMDGNSFRNGIATLRIGGQGRGARNRFFAGVIDEARIYNRALTEAEIDSYMNAAIGTAPGAPTNLRIIR
jgi:concanavalin A-like lectin/glucanase superfamily protein/Big-like domain-containing protein/fibronectin type III domain protein/parallel beta helix pectate lyase-like protein